MVTTIRELPSLGSVPFLSLLTPRTQAGFTVCRMGGWVIGDSSDCYKGVLKKLCIYLMAIRQHRLLKSNVSLLLIELL